MRTCQVKGGSPSSGTPPPASVCSCATFCCGVRAPSNASSRCSVGREASSQGRLLLLLLPACSVTSSAKETGKGAQVGTGSSGG